MKSTSQHLFTRAPQAEIPRSKFTTPFTYKTAFNSGKLVPFYVDEALPGDTFNCKFTHFARLATPACPFMDNLYLDFHFFAVPIRLVWDNFPRMMGERRNPEDSIDFLAPVMTSPADGFGYESMSDYMGIPPNVPNLDVSSLWHRAYNLIWNEWYRDTRLQNRVPVPLGDGPDNPSDFVLLPRGKRHDYFTSCLPWPQEGPGVSIPLGETAPVVYGASNPADSALNGRLAFSRMESGHATDYNFNPITQSTAVNPTSVEPLALQADLSNAASATINSLRQAFQLQRLLERDARGGDRYCSILESHFGVVSPDARLQRPEYLGGASRFIQVHSVAQTSSSDGTSPQGNLAGYGVSSGDCGFQKSFVEHTLILGLVSIRADLTYQQGLPRMFSRRSRYDWYWPALANLGEQAVLNKEIYAQGKNVIGETGIPADDEVFGYQERWAEYRYGVSKITGKLRSSFAQSLDVWHLAEHFEDLPKLNASFIESKPPVSRVLAVTDEPEIIFDCVGNCSKVRPLPLYSVPGLIDHL